MNDTVISGGAETAVPIDTDHVNLPDPVGTQHQPEPVEPEAKPEVEAKERPEPKKPKSIDDSLKDAMAKSKAKAAEKAEPKPKEEPPKEPAKQVAESPKAPEPARPVEKPTEYAEAPARFHETAKAEWATAPTSVRAEVHRMSQEYEKGLGKYREDAEAFEAIRPFHDLARQSGTDLKTALTRFVGLEQELRRDPISGLEAVVQNLGLKGPNGQPATLRDVAAHILGQKPDQVASRQEAVIGQLRQQVSQLQQQLGGVSQMIQGQQVSALEGEVARFSAEHSRFAELQDDIMFFLTSGRISANLPTQDRLAQAYEMAARLNPDPTAPLTPAQPLAQTQAPLKPPKPAGQKSVTGSPSSEPNYAPAKKGPAPSIDEALSNALRRAS